jgi:hypothetical protein
MKISQALIIWAILLISFSCWAEIYHVDSALGNDRNNGLSPSLPWKTIARVNAHASSIRDGDKILFKRGEVWQGSQQSLGHTGSSSVNWHGVDNVTIGDYGDPNDSRPWFNGNYFGPIRLDGDGSCSGWIIKNIDISGMDGWGSINQGAMKLKNFVNLTISGIFADGHKGATKFPFHIQMIDLVDLTGNFLMKDCEFRNMYKRGDFNGWDPHGQDAHIMFIDKQTDGTMKFINNVFSGAYADLVQYWHADNIVWERNLFEKFGENCVDQKAITNVSYINNIFSRGWSKFKGSGNKSHLITHSHDSVVSANVNIENNVFNGGHDDRGISIQSATRDTTIRGNRFSNFDIAIYLYHSLNAFVTENEICGSDKAIDVGSRSTNVTKTNNDIVADCLRDEVSKLSPPQKLRIK